MTHDTSQNLQIGDPETKVRLMAQGHNLWRVRMLFPTHKASEIPEQLRQIKVELAHSFGVADYRLEYVGLYSKRKTSSGILVEMQIRRQEIPVGSVRVRYLPMTATDGTVFSDMQVAVDLFPLDDFEQQLTFESVEERLKAEGVDTGLVHWVHVRELVESCRRQQVPLLDQVVGEGVMPDVGIPAKVLYRWFPSDDEAAPTAWMGLRVVETGEELCDLNVPVSGLKAGKNIFGKELSPRRGNSTRLVAGKGVALSTTERRFVSREEGVVVFHRRYQDRRMKDSPRETPAIVEAEVLQMRNIRSEKAQNERWEGSIWITGSFDEPARLMVNGDCVFYGDIADGCQIQVSGNLRIFGGVGEATLTVGNHLCVHGPMFKSMCEVGLTAQLIGEVSDCTVFAREIIADNIVGGVAEAYANVSTNNEFVQLNKEKLLAEQRAAGEDALLTLRKQIVRLNEIFGPEMLQQVTPDTVQIHLLRWLRQQKTLGVASYTYPQVQELRTLLELVPTLRAQMASIAGELRETSASD